MYKTERLIIRPTTVEDAPFILELLNSPKWLKYIGNRNLKTVEDAQHYIETKMIPQYKNLGFSNNTVIRKSDGAKIGTCGLYNREGIDGVDIGFAFLPEYEQQGYAFEASNKIKDTAFNELDLNTISAITLPENTSSRKLLEKLGLSMVGPIKIPGDDEELLLYRIDK